MLDSIFRQHARFLDKLGMTFSKFGTAVSKLGMTFSKFGTAVWLKTRVLLE